MKSNLKTLLDWFPSGTAEGELDILDEAFVSINEFEAAISPIPGNPCLLIGRKGSGKSALINFAANLLSKKGVPALVLRPSDIDTTSMSDDASTGDMLRSFKFSIMDSISDKALHYENAWFSGDAQTLHSAAVAAGRRTPEFASKMGRFLLAAAQPLLSVDINAALPNLTLTSRQDVAKALAGIVDRKSFYLFFDDTDQVANPNQPFHLNRIWSLILALRQLSAEMRELKIVITLRTEVWERLKHDGNGQRDQIDHFSALVVPMPANEELVKRIVARRLDLASARCESKADGYSTFFDGQLARAPYSEEKRTWSDLISVRSRKRPRDAIQLVNRMARFSTSRGGEKINEDDFRSVMPGFSEDIAKNLFQEVSLELPEAHDVLRRLSLEDFDQGGFTFSAEVARQFFKKTLSAMPLNLYGVRLRQNSDHDLLQLWRFFYLQDVLNARISDIRQPDGYRHIDPLSDPTLVSQARWNDMQKMLWEVNTAYRDYLIAVQASEASRTGLARKQKHRPKRR